jgi:hypothetical protein
MTFVAKSIYSLIDTPDEGKILNIALFCPSSMHVA